MAVVATWSEDQFPRSTLNRVVDLFGWDSGPRIDPRPWIVDPADEEREGATGVCYVTEKDIKNDYYEVLIKIVLKHHTDPTPTIWLPFLYVLSEYQ